MAYQPLPVPKPVADVLVTSSPGATTSSSGPKFENVARTALASVAPTAIAFAYFAG